MNIQMTDRLHKKLVQSKGKEVVLTRDADEEGFNNWHADIVTLHRRKALLLVHNESLMSIVLWPLLKKYWANVENVIGYGIQRFLDHLGINWEDQMKLFPREDMECRFTQSLSSKVVTRMNAMIEKMKYKRWKYAEDYMIQFEVMNHLNEWVNDEIDEESVTPIERWHSALEKFDFGEIEHGTVPQFELSIVLGMELKEKIKRVIHVPALYSFQQFHEIIQKLFMWRNYHLHEFQLKLFDNRYLIIGEDMDEEYLVPNNIKRNESNTQLIEYLRVGDVFTYLYDFGDHWEHRIEVKKVIASQTRLPHLIEMEGDPIPEDVGGVYGYSEFKETMEDETSEEYESYKTWASSYFFNLESHNEEILNKQLFNL